MPEEGLRNIDSEHHGKKASFKWPDFTVSNALIVVLVLLLVLAGLYILKPDLFKSIGGRGKQSAKSDQKVSTPEVKGSGYSAVFLANDQVYFGKLSDANSQYPKLAEVYYLRVDRPLQPPPATESAQPDVQLVKLGNELHGPLDEIKFNRDQILYIEDLKDDSRIVVAIREFKSRK